MSALPDRTPTLTHPETAWLVTAVPLWLTVGLVLLFALAAQHQLRDAIAAMLLRYQVRHQRDIAHPALVWTAPIITESRLVGICLVTVTLLMLAMQALAPVFVALVLAGPVAALVIWVLLWVLTRHYVARLDAALPAAVGRLEVQLRSGSGLQNALQKVRADMPPGPLDSEWAFLVTKLGTPLSARSLATPQHVVAALLAQTPSPRHATFLAHLELALEQPHSAMVARVRAAYTALQAAEQRRSAALTELSQMRYSGVAISLAGLSMTLYLFLAQQQRFLAAYQGLLGTIAGAVVLAALLAPLVGGYLLSRAEDMEY